MKAILIIAALAVGLCAQAQENTLATTDGTTYTGITFQRVEPDGIYIEYTLPGGGIGMSKVKFARLPGTIQRHYGYSASSASEYESEVAQANANVAKELTERNDARRNARQRREVENEQAYAGRMAQIARVNAEHAAAFYRTTKPDPYGFRTIETSPQFTGGRISTQTSFTPPAPDIFPNRGVNTRIAVK